MTGTTRVNHDRRTGGNGEIARDPGAVIDSPESVVSVAFALKEWSSICRSLESGDSALILRKGGIHDGRAGLGSIHPSFLLMPTLYHQTEASGRRAPTGPTVARSACELIDVIELGREADLAPIDGLHAYTNQQIERRLRFRPTSPLLAIIVRTFLLRRPIKLEDLEPRACRSWLPIGSQSPEIERRATADALIARTIDQCRMSRMSRMTSR
jgi:hypothetical protein